MSEFIYTPDYVLDESLEYKTLVSSFENGSEQRRRSWKTPRHKWTLRFNNRAASEVEAIKTFFMNTAGAYASFTWTNPNDNTEYTVRFVQDTLHYILKNYNLYDLSFDLIEVF